MGNVVAGESGAAAFTGWPFRAVSLRAIADQTFKNGLVVVIGAKGGVLGMHISNRSMPSARIQQAVVFCLTLLFHGAL